MGSKVLLGDVIRLDDSRRQPLSSRQREGRKGSYPYYGAQGVVDHLDDYTYDGTYLLVAEDGENLRSRKLPLANLVTGKFRVNNHAHVLSGTDKCDIRILGWLLNSMNLTPYVTGSTQPKLSQKNLLAIELDLPSVEEQQSIMAILGSIDNKIALNKQTNDYLTQAMEALYRKFFSYDNQSYGSIYDIAVVVYGAPFSSKLFNETGQGWPLIRIRDLSTFEPQFFTEEEHPKRTFIEPGDVVAGMDAEFTPTLWLGERAVLNQRVCEFVPPPESAITKSYLLFATKPLLAYVQNYATGTTVAHLGKSDLEALNVPLPREEDLIAFGAVAEPMRLAVVANARESARLAALRDTLLPKLMSGEVDVSRVELSTPPNNHLSAD